MLQGSEQSLKHSKMVFQINKCSEKDNVTCASSEEIDKFISRLEIETWANFDKTDLSTIKNGKAVQRIEKFISHNIITPNRTTIDVFNVR